MRTLVGFFHQPGAIRWAFAVLPLYLAGIAVAYPLVIPMLVDYGWPLDTIGTVWIIGGGGIAMVAALAAGGLLSAIRRRPALVGLALIQLAAIAALLLMALSTGGALVGLAAVVLLSGAYAAVGTAVYTISMDLPFAQKRWCGAAGIQRVKTLSDFREKSFGQAYGTLIKEGPLAGLECRAVFVVGKDGQVKHVEYVSDIAKEPNYEAALAAARAAAG